MRWIHDGSGRPPRLRREFGRGTLENLPPWSVGPRGDLPQLLAGRALKPTDTGEIAAAAAGGRNAP